MACNPSRSGPGRSFRSATMRRTAALSAGGNVSIDISVYVIRPEGWHGSSIAGGSLRAGPPPPLWSMGRRRGWLYTQATDRAIRGSFAPCQAHTGALAVDVDTYDSGRAARGCDGPGHGARLGRQSRPHQRLHLPRGLGE